MVAGMGPSPAHDGQATGMTPKVTTRPSRVSMVPCSVRGEPLEETRQSPSKRKMFRGQARGGCGPWSPTCRIPVFLGTSGLSFAREDSGLFPKVKVPSGPGESKTGDRN